MSKRPREENEGLQLLVLLALIVLFYVLLK